MHQTQSRAKGYRAGESTLQNTLQLLLLRVQTTINDVTSVKHLSGRAIRDIEQIIHRGPPFTLDDLPAFADAIENLHGTIDDREFLLEKVLTLLARLPDDTALGKMAQQHIIDLLYKDLPHPPTGFLSTFHNVPSTTAEEQSVPYAFRSADGSNNSVLFPSLGQAGQPYARSVPSTHIRSVPSLPDPGVVFDTLLCRPDDDFVPHPGGLSSLFFAFADLIVHSIFSTNKMDWTINDTSSYLDLSIVYGSSAEQVESIRRKDGTGTIWNDAFADGRLLFMPPSVCALAVLFSRHHNYIAQKILNLNERGSFTSPPPGKGTSRLAQDDEIFHRARLVNTAFFMQIILAEYVGAILGLVRDGLTWRLDPLKPSRESDHSVSPRGEGNAVSIEFNLLYHWHTSISQEDEKWLNGLFGEVFERRDPKTVTAKEFGKLARGKFTPSGDVKNWTFGGLVRGTDGSFSDQDIARILHDATERRAGAFGARGIPPVMRVIEILTIEQGRKWGACTLNEFRKFMGLRPYESFREWNPDPTVHSAAEVLYGHIDNLELHVGLQAEETKPTMQGAGLCPGYTISRAILADAVSLTRGDRFLTVDYTPYNLTSWGYQYCMSNPDDGSYGGMLSKLLFVLLPDQYPAGSSYANFPFMTPDFMRACIASRSVDDLAYYDFSRPNQVEDNGGALYKKRMLRLTKGIVVALGKARQSIVNETLAAVSFPRMFATLVEKASISGSRDTKVVDIVKDVINRMPVYWAANFVLGLPVSTFDGAWGGHTISHWSNLFADVTKYVYLNHDPVHDWTLYQAALRATDEIMYYLNNRLQRLRDGTISLAGASDLLVTSVITSNVQNSRFISNILASFQHSTVRTIASHIIAETVPSALLFSVAISSVVDYYTSPGREEALQKLIRLSTAGQEDATEETLVKFINVALANGGSSATWRFLLDNHKEATHKQNGGGTKPLPRGSTEGDYEIDTQGLGGLMSRDLFAKLATQVVAAIFGLKGIQFSAENTEYDEGLPASRVVQYEI